MEITLDNNFESVSIEIPIDYTPTDLRRTRGMSRAIRTFPKKMITAFLTAGLLFTAEPQVLKPDLGADYDVSQIEQTIFDYKIHRFELAKELYQEGKLSQDEWNRFKRSEPYFDKIERNQEILGISYLASLYGAESDFIPRLSPKGADKIGQLTDPALEELIRKIGNDEWILNNVFPGSLEKINHLTNLDNISFEELGFDEKGYQKSKESFSNLTEEEIRQVIIPRYNKLNKIFPENNIDKVLAYKDPDYHIDVTSAVYFSNGLEVGHQLNNISKKHNINPINFFKEGPKFIQEVKRAPYNCGMSRLKFALENALISGDGDVFRRLPEETREHKDRINDYTTLFRKVEFLTWDAYISEKNQPKPL